MKKSLLFLILAISFAILSLTGCNRGGATATPTQAATPATTAPASTTAPAPTPTPASGGGGGDGIWPGSWPSANVRADFSISDLDQPPNTWVSHYSIEYGGSVLSITFTSTNYDDTQTYLNNWFTSNGWVVYGTATPGSVIWRIQSIYPMARFIYSDVLAVLDVVMD